MDFGIIKEAHGLKAAVVPITWLGPDVGWGNGYVLLPKEHPWYGMEYEEIPVDIHGGLTYTGYWEDAPEQADREKWWIGFDCAHHGDTRHNRNELWVYDETIRLLNQALSVIGVPLI